MQCALVSNDIFNHKFWGFEGKKVWCLMLFMTILKMIFGALLESNYIHFAIVNFGVMTLVVLELLLII